jgi:hypothetical protein
VTASPDVDDLMAEHSALVDRIEADVRVVKRVLGVVRASGAWTQGRPFSEACLAAGVADADIQWLRTHSPEDLDADLARAEELATAIWLSLGAAVPWNQPAHPASN